MIYSALIFYFYLCIPLSRFISSLGITWTSIVLKGIGSQSLHCFNLQSSLCEMKWENRWEFYIIIDSSRSYSHVWWYITIFLIGFHKFHKFQTCMLSLLIMCQFMSLHFLLHQWFFSMNWPCFHLVFWWSIHTWIHVLQCHWSIAFMSVQVSTQSG